MKNQKKKDRLITESYFDKKLVLERSYLDKKIDRVMRYIDFKLEEVMEFKSEFKEFKEVVTKSLDWLVGAFKRLDEERIASSEQHTRLRNQVENYDVRIKTLEKQRIFS